MKPIFFKYCRKIMDCGYGRRTRFWEDLWLGDNPLCIKFPRLHSLTFSANSLVPKLIKSEFATVRFRRNLCGGG